MLSIGARGTQAAARQFERDSSPSIPGLPGKQHLPGERHPCRGQWIAGQAAAVAKAVQAAAASFPVAIVTSSNRETLELVCQQLQLVELLSATVGAEDCTESKPHPEPFLLGAKALGLSPDRCLIFEDSTAGVQAGLASGATVIAIGSSSGHEPSIADYTMLPAGFFSALTEEALD